MATKSGKSWRAAFISDLQMPFEARHSLKFVKAVCKYFNINTRHDLYNVGDEVDQYFGSQYLKDPDAWHTANSEIRVTVEKVRQWKRAYPFMKLCRSNHGERWAKKAVNAEIPSQMMKAYQEIIEAPAGWLWKDKWSLTGGHQRVDVIHGMGYSGVSATRNLTLDSGNNSVVFGHLHSNAGIVHLKTQFKEVWAMNTGCLIDMEAYAFQYSKHNRSKAQLGMGIVLDGGRLPIWVPYETFI